MMATDIVPKNLRLVQTDDYVIDNGKLYLLCDGMVKIKHPYLKQTVDLKDWFETGKAQRVLIRLGA